MVRPCKNAFVIAGSYVHSILPSGEKLCDQLWQHSKLAQLAIKAKVRSLECHLNESILAKSIASDKVLSIPLEFQSLAIVLAYQVA